MTAFALAYVFAPAALNFVLAGALLAQRALRARLSMPARRRASLALALLAFLALAWASVLVAGGVGRISPEERARYVATLVVFSLPLLGFALMAARLAVVLSRRAGRG